MGLVVEIIKFIVYSFIIVIVSKHILVRLLRKLAEILDLSPKAVRKCCRGCNIYARAFDSIFLKFTRNV